MGLFIYMLAPLGGTVLVLIFMRMVLEHRMKWWQIPLTALVMELTMIPRILFGVDSVPSVAANLICMAACLMRQNGCGTRILTSLATRYDGAYQTRFEDGIYTALLSLIMRA